MFMLQYEPYGHPVEVGTYMLPHLTQVKILTLNHKISFLSQNVSLFRMVSPFYDFMQLFMLILQFIMGNHNFLSLQ
jgi:hypothetical protein